MVVLVVLVVVVVVVVVVVGGQGNPQTFEAIGIPDSLQPPQVMPAVGKLLQSLSELQAGHSEAGQSLFHPPGPGFAYSHVLPKGV